MRHSTASGISSKPDQDVELVHGERGEAVHDRGLAQDDQVEPAAAPLAPGRRAELVALLTEQATAFAFVLGRERAAADARRVRLRDAEDLVDPGRGRRRSRCRPGRRRSSTRSRTDRCRGRCRGRFPGRPRRARSSHLEERDRGCDRCGRRRARACGRAARAPRRARRRRSAASRAPSSARSS